MSNQTDNEYGYLVIASTKVYEGEFEAVVSYRASLEEAKGLLHSEAMCFSDEGIRYRIVERDKYNWVEESNCEYDWMIERTIK